MNIIQHIKDKLATALQDVKRPLDIDVNELEFYDIDAECIHFLRGETVYTFGWYFDDKDVYVEFLTHYRIG